MASAGARRRSVNSAAGPVRLGAAGRRAHRVALLERLLVGDDPSPSATVSSAARPWGSAIVRAVRAVREGDVLMPQAARQAARTHLVFASARRIVAATCRLRRRPGLWIAFTSDGVQTRRPARAPGGRAGAAAVLRLERARRKDRAASEVNCEQIVQGDDRESSAKIHHRGVFNIQGDDVFSA